MVRIQHLKSWMIHKTKSLGFTPEKCNTSSYYFVITGLYEDIVNSARLYYMNDATQIWINVLNQISFIHLNQRNALCDENQQWIYMISM